MEPKTREEKLKQELENLGMVLRKDSELCKKYIENGDECGHTLDQVVNIMYEMEFYCKKTPYKVLLRKEKKEALSGINKSDWTDEQEDELRNKVKDKVLKNFAFRYKNKELPSLPPSILKRIKELTESSNV